VDGSFTDMTPITGSLVNLLKLKDSQDEQTDRCSRRWPVRNGCFRSSFGRYGSGSSTGSSRFDGSQDDAQEEDFAQEVVAQEGSIGRSSTGSRYGRIAVSLM
jgi:hypothetical protein